MSFIYGNYSFWILVVGIIQVGVMIWNHHVIMIRHDRWKHKKIKEKHSLGPQGPKQMRCKGCECLVTKWWETPKGCFCDDCYREGKWI